MYFLGIRERHVLRFPMLNRGVFEKTVRFKWVGSRFEFAITFFADLIGPCFGDNQNVIDAKLAELATSAAYELSLVWKRNPRVARKARRAAHR
jgi:hypothetical protein